MALLKHAPERVQRLQMKKDGAGREALVALAEQQGVSIQWSKRVELEGVVHQGVIAWVVPAEYRPWAELLATPPMAGRAPLLFAADQITDPRNLGAILRSAEALGLNGALLTRSRCARLGPTVTKTSAGASELLPVALEANLARSLREAREAGFQVIGADMTGEAPTRLDWSGPTVIVVGAEGHGLRRLTRDLCDQIVAIPQLGETESLNASVAASILFYEARRATLSGVEAP